MLSGGEKVSLALALRLAIAHILSGKKQNFLMLDEPTIHLDEERRRYLVKAINRLFRGGKMFTQMLVVTHDRELEDMADVVYRVVKTPNGSKVLKQTGLT